jgi:4-diphosphocytidyl-2-C-methyl-D-erythritol kinase
MIQLLGLHRMNVILQSYAKINLGLFIQNKREDGYHNIATVFQQINLHDTLTFTRIKSSSIKIYCNKPSIPVNEDNLVYKAFQLYQRHTNSQGGLEVHIKKQIPAGGGLGGGSSNAAVTLRACEALWQQPLSDSCLEELAFKIGSDVPFFLKGGTAIGAGRGEQLIPLNLPQLFWVVLVCPGFPVSTGWAYNQTKIGLTNAEKISTLRALFGETEVHTWRDKLVNELESVVFQRHPELRDVKEQLYNQCAFYASMSGSGSTMFGLFQDRALAKATVKFFANQQMRALLAQPITVHAPK